MFKYFSKLWDLAANELSISVDDLKKIAATLEKLDLVECLQRETKSFDYVKMSRAELVTLACFDQLTGLPNSSLLKDRIKQLISHYRRSNGGFALMFIDLDGFKSINDTLGHQAGDKVLKNVAKLLQRTVRDCDTVARLHGDEFVIILDNILADSQNDKNNIMIYKKLARKILTSINNIILGGQKVNLSASIGVSFFPEHKTVDGLLSSADISMYEAKNNGKNTLSLPNKYNKHNS